MTKPARVCYFDIETAPSLVYVWQHYLRHGGSNVVHTVQPWYMLSVSWKWAGEKQVHFKGLCDFPLFKKNKADDSELIKVLHRIFCESDVLIAHNGDRFDIKKTNSRFWGVGLPPPSPYKTIDTLKIARRVFSQDSNKLASLGEYLGLGGKTPHMGWTTWQGCIDGDPKAWATMRKYNKRDVILLEQVAERLFPWCPKTQKLLAKIGA